MTPRERDTAAAGQRKEQILDAAAALFANNGYYKTTTAMVAAEVGVTQPYVFHFFKTKEDLYLAVLDRAKDRLTEAFAAVEAPPERLAYEMGNAFYTLMETHRDETLLCMQSYTTPELHARDYVRGLFVNIHETVARKFERAGIPKPHTEASLFIACGLVVSLAEILEAPQLKL